MLSFVITCNFPLFFVQCNVVCGNGIQFRSVACQINGVTVSDAECDPSTRPATENSCNVGACGWVTGNFGPCSVTCGPDQGQQIRTVTCSNLINNQIVSVTNCDSFARPSNFRNCISGEDCPLVMWFEGPFGEVSHQIITLSCRIESAQLLKGIKLHTTQFPYHMCNKWSGRYELLIINLIR